LTYAAVWPRVVDGGKNKAGPDLGGIIREL
jgi:hypothetical protein